MKTRILKRIEEINNLLPIINELEAIPVTYAGGTWPYYVEIKPITINGKFVTIEAVNKKDRYQYISKARFNINKTDYFDDNGLYHLNETTKHILKSLKNEKI